jgi:hypothetical protein
MLFFDECLKACWTRTGTKPPADKDQVGQEPNKAVGIDYTFRCQDHERILLLTEGLLGRLSEYNSLVKRHLGDSSALGEGDGKLKVQRLP